MAAGMLLLGCSGSTEENETTENMDFIKLAAERYSVRSFQDKAIEKEKLDLILKAGQLAPTAANLQPQKVYILKSEKALQTVDGLTRSRYGAPVVLLVTYNKDIEWNNRLEPGVTAGEQDASIVATHMMMEAADLGLGSVWVCGFSPSKAKEAFNIPENEVVVMMLPIGYPAEDAKPSPMHTSRKPLEETTQEL